MPRIIWDADNERTIEYGVSRGVLYVKMDARDEEAGTDYYEGVPWNGLTNVTIEHDGFDSSRIEASGFVYDILRSPETLSGSIEAYTYPEEFCECEGAKHYTNGATIMQQKHQPFGLCYRTELNNGQYVLHVIYDCTSILGESVDETVNDTADAKVFHWDFDTFPYEMDGYSPFSELLFYSGTIPADKMVLLENCLYGSASNDPTLPTPENLLLLVYSGEYIPPSRSDNADALIEKRIVTYTGNVSYVGEFVFRSCYSLTFANFPVCRHISKYAFEDCPNLATVSFPECRHISYAAFTLCSSLTSVDFPVCTSIGTYVFESCYNLTTINFPACTSIDHGAFEYCYNLTIASFPACTRLDGNVFYCCSNLTTVSFPICSYIGTNTFYNCSSLTSAYFPLCENILDYAFQHCTNLTTASFPECVAIYGRVFEDCTNLTTVSFPECYYIGRYAFWKCTNLTALSFPACASIGSSAFEECSSLSLVYLLSTSRVSLYSYSTCFASTPLMDSTYLGYYGSIYVPESLVDDYKQTYPILSDRFTAYIE